MAKHYRGQRFSLVRQYRQRLSEVAASFCVTGVDRRRIITAQERLISPD
jgi:hypothetical protein